MRVLVLTTERALSTTARLLAMMGAGLAARGDHVVFVPRRKSEVDGFLSRRFPKHSAHAISGRGGVAQALAVRKIVGSTRADVILVACERDQLTAALAIGRNGGVVRRLEIGERFELNWRTKLAASRSTCLLMGDHVGADVHQDSHVRAGIAWPRPVPIVPGETTVRVATSRPPSVLAVVAGDSSDPAEHGAGATALRAAARLLTRHAELRVLLLGDTSAMQALRLHAASVGLADRVDVAPLESLIEPGVFSASAVWVTAAGDKGAVSIVSAMMRRLPVIVPHGFDTESLVASRITGFVADDTDLSGSVAAVAHILADADAHHAMGAAAASRAERAHGWEALLRNTQAALSRVAGKAAHHNSAA